MYVCLQSAAHQAHLRGFEVSSCSGTPVCGRHANHDKWRPNMDSRAPPVYIERPAPTEAEAPTQAVSISLEQKTIAKLNNIDPFDFDVQDVPLIFIYFHFYT